MKEKKCINCGALIPEGSFICSHCASENDMQTFEAIRDNRIKKCKDIVEEKLKAATVDELGEAIKYALETPFVLYDGKMITIAEAIKILRNGNGGTVMKWRKCSDAQPKTPRNALVIVDGKITIAYWTGYEWESHDWRLEIDPDYWQNLPLLPAEMMQNGE